MMTDFIDFLTSLPPEGECLLFVRQIPTGKTHGDGKPAYTWPASKRPYKEGATFVNGGCFIVERFKGKVSAAEANCERVALMLIDDVGTKSPVPPIAPTWIMETSEANFQYVYVFALDDQPRVGEFKAAMQAIAAAGMTDPGAVNATRNMRMPGSVNLKEGRNGFVSRLIEFHPEREFSLPQICNALGVSPSEAHAQRLHLSLEDDGGDDVLGWLSEQGLVTERANGSGWYGVQCVNHAAHSDGNVGARYLPSNRAFVCYHGSCQDIHSAEFLRWVADQGGPDHQPGARDDLVAKKVGAALSKLTPTKDYPDRATQIVAETEQRELGRIQKEEWYKEFAYVLPDDGYFSMTTRQELTRRGFDAIYRGVACKTIHGERKAKVSASIAFDESRQEKGARVLNGIAYAPGESVLILRNGDAFGNRWKDARQAGVPGDVTPWLDHCAALVPDPAQREHIFNVMAYKLQNPSVKINHAILMGGAPGCGKDTLFAPFIWAVCGPGLQNYALVDAERIESQWGYHYESEIFVLNELKEPEARERRALANKLKPVIAAPPDVLSVNRKGLAPYDAANRLLVLAFTNDYNPISIESDDRRWMCVWSHAPKMTDGRAIWNWYKSGGYEACAAWLWACDVSAFNPAAPAPVTEWKQSMAENSLSASESAIVDCINAGQGDFRAGVVAAPWQAVARRLEVILSMKVHQNAVLHALKEAGWVDCGRVMSREHTTKRHLFVRPDMAQLSKSDLRNMVEEPPAPLMQLVK